VSSREVAVKGELGGKEAEQPGSSRSGGCFRAPNGGLQRGHPVGVDLTGVRKEPSGVGKRSLHQQFAVFELDGLSRGRKQGLSMPGIAALSFGVTQADQKLAAQSLVHRPFPIQKNESLPEPVAGVVRSQIGKGLICSLLGVTECLVGILGSGGQQPVASQLRYPIALIDA
jgi:hypothetical protein